MDGSLKKREINFKYVVEIFILYVLLNPGFLYLLYKLITGTEE